jgi:fluoride ion exporter CrcB/FEX
MANPNTALRPRALLQAGFAVFVGGATGTLLRDLALKVHPIAKAPLADHAHWTALIPWTLLVINFVGVVLATNLLRGALRGKDPNDLTRLLLITGFFGGFTSYSTLFLNLHTIWGYSHFGTLCVAILAVFSGVLGGWLGLRRWWRV